MTNHSHMNQTLTYADKIHSAERNAEKNLDEIRELEKTEKQMLESLTKTY